MMNKFLSWPIRTQLSILLVVLALPSMILIVRSGIEERNESMRWGTEECSDFVHMIAAEHQAVVAGARQLATSLALLPEVQSHNVEAANALFTDLLKANPQYVNISVADKSGVVWASAVPFEGTVSVADRKSFRETIRTGTFSSGEYGVGRLVKKPVINFGYPVKSRYGTVAAVVAVALNLDYVQQISDKIRRPDGASFSLLNHQGTIITRNLKDPFSEKLTGKRDMREELFTKMKEGPSEGTFESMGNDGNFRLVAYKKISLPHESEPYLYIRSSIPLASLTSKAYTAMVKKLGLLVLVFGAGLVVVWIIGKRAIMKPILLLKEASRQLESGRGSVNVSDVVKGGELGELARAFDSMAQTLAERENALRESEERWETTLASVGDAVIATDTDARITFMNAVAEDLTGWTLAEASQKPIAEVFNIVNEHTRHKVESPVFKVLEQGTIVGLANHTILIRKDGTEAPIDDSGAPIKGKDGKTIGVVLVFRDITKRKENEENIKRLASFPELNPHPVLEVGLSGEITFCNPVTEGLLESFGLDKRDCRAFVPQDMDAVLRDWDGNSESTLERKVVIKERVFGEFITLVPQFKVARIYARDITERKQAEDALIRAKEEWERTFASVPDMIALIDNQYRIMRVNDALARRLGVKTEEGIGLFCYEAVHKLSEPPHFCPHSRTAKDGLQHIEEIREERLGGDFLVSTTPLYDDQGEMAGSVHVLHDITERKRAEEALRETRDELELRVQERTSELQRAYDTLQTETAQRKQAEDQLFQARKMEAIGTLAGGIAHDFNNILAGIIGFTEIALDDTSPDGLTYRPLKLVLQSGFRARDLVKQILAFSRKTEHKREPVSLSPLVSETLQLIRASLSTAIKITVNIGASSDNVFADPSELQQIIMNLCTNAAFAMRDTGGELNIALAETDIESGSTVTPELPPGQYVELTVKDTGTGMDRDVMARMFEPFFTTKEVGQGTGLGLAVVYGIVKSLRGDITVESTPGMGSTFRVLLPRVSEDVELYNLGQEAPGGKERILFIDDEELLAELGKGRLQRLGYKVTAITDGTEALQVFSKDPTQFDLVLTDQAMPGITGFYLAQELLKLRADIPIILCTGYSDSVSEEKAMAMGIRGLLMKPLSKHEMAVAVRRALDTLP